MRRALRSSRTFDVQTFSPTVMRVCSLKGDGRYSLKKWLMTPVESPGTAAEFQYNLAHTVTHEIVDRTFRAIQTRFRCLDGIKGNLQV